MRVLLFQHIDCEHPGSLRQFLAADEIEWDAVELDQGEPIPSFENYDALWVAPWMSGMLMNTLGLFQKKRRSGSGYVT